MTHLWEIEHPYYCEEGNWFKTGQHTQFADWADFTSTFFYSGDRDQNLLIRWDWRKPGHSEFTDDAEYLQMHFVLQRKAWLCSVRIPVSEADEPAVRAFLESCARTMAATWEPLAVLLRATADHRPDPTALRAAARDLDEVAGPEPTQPTEE